MKLHLVALLSVAVFAAACGESAAFLKTTASFQPTAEGNYEQGVRMLRAGNYQLAQQYFQYIRNKFGFSKWSTMAELALADVDFGREKYTEAIDEYRQFMRAHPNHERVQDGYAAFKICEAGVKQMPTGWFLSPPDYEKDQSPANDAFRELNDFVAQYTDSPYIAPGKKLWQTAVKQLTDHELYVANFYLKLDKPKAAIWRLEGVLKEYKGAKREPEALLLLGRTYLQMKDAPHAKVTFKKLIADHAEDYRAIKAQLYLDQIKKQYGEVDDPPPPPTIDPRPKQRVNPHSNGGDPAGEG